MDKGISAAKNPPERRAAGLHDLFSKLILLAYFVYFAFDGLRAHWAPDDMMNLAGYWERGPWRAIWSQASIGVNAYRPMGALFYLPLFYAFGLNPFPYRIVAFCLLAINLWTVYRLAESWALPDGWSGSAA